MRALVTGGYFDDSGEGVVWEVDMASEQARVFLRWSPPTHLRVPTKGFAGGGLCSDGTLYVAAHAAVVRISTQDAAVSGILHQPCMNDLHHVAIDEDLLYVANTGLSAVDVLTRAGDFLGSHALLPAWASARRLGGQDPPVGQPPVHPGWRGVSPPSWGDSHSDDGYHSPDRTSAPFHRLKVRDYLHVNHVARIGNRLVATCFADGSLRSLETFSVLARFPGRFLHDGVLSEDGMWISAIDGSLLELEAETFRVRRQLSAFQTGHYGWCRGLAVTPEHLLVGMTEVRSSRLPRHRWAEREPAGSETSVLLLDRQDGHLLARVDLTDAGRHAKLYSILPLVGAFG